MKTVGLKSDNLTNNYERIVIIPLLLLLLAFIVWDFYPGSYDSQFSSGGKFLNVSKGISDKEHITSIEVTQENELKATLLHTDIHNLKSLWLGNIIFFTFLLTGYQAVKPIVYKHLKATTFLLLILLIAISIVDFYYFSIWINEIETNIKRMT